MLTNCNNGFHVPVLVQVRIQQKSYSNPVHTVPVLAFQVLVQVNSPDTEQISVLAKAAHSVGERRVS
jgi:hypothetical protein